MWMNAKATIVKIMQLASTESIHIAANVPLDGVELIVTQVSSNGIEK